MNDWDFTFPSPDIPAVTSESRLERALRNGRAGTVYAALDKLERPLKQREAISCTMAALGRPVKIFEAVLDHCVPPVERAEKRGGGLVYPFCEDLVLLAAADGRAEHLDLLLNRGISPNGRHPGNTVASALRKRSVRCVKRLLAAPDLNTEMTAEILEEWAKGNGGDKALDDCLRAMCPRYLGKKVGPRDPIPVPDGLKLNKLAGSRNLRMARQFFKEREVSRSAASSFLSKLCYDCDINLDDLCALLDAMFCRDPGLLGLRWPRTVLAACALAGRDGVPEILKPWLERMPGRYILLIPDPTIDWVPCQGRDLPDQISLGGPRKEGLLSRWDERLGSRFQPALDRNKGVGLWRTPFMEESGETMLAKSAETLIERCHIMGKVRRDRLSPLADTALELLSPDSIIRELRPGGLLAAEYPERVVEYAMDGHCPTGKRNLILAYLKREVRYEL